VVNPQAKNLMACPTVRSQAEAGQMTQHGWHYVIEEGVVHVFDVHSGHGPYVEHLSEPLFNDTDTAYNP
jgi:carbonic anhydrase